MIYPSFLGFFVVFYLGWVWMQNLKSLTKSKDLSTRINLHFGYYNYTNRQITYKSTVVMLINSRDVYEYTSVSFIMSIKFVILK